MAERRLWPRALLTPFTDRVRLTAADERAYTGYAGSERHKGFEVIDVGFDPPPDSTVISAPRAQRVRALVVNAGRADPRERRRSVRLRHTPGNRPEKGVLSVVELTLRARSSALEAKATEARQRRGAELEAMTETRRA